MENKTVHAKLIKAHRDDFNDIDWVLLEDEKSNTLKVNASDVIKALENKRIEIKGLKLTKNGVLKETARPGNKRPESKEKLEIKALEKKISRYTNSGDFEKVIRLRKELYKKLDDPAYSNAYERIQVDINKKINKKIKKNT